MFLEKKWGIIVHKSIICRLLKVDRMSRKKGQRIGHVQSQQFRIAWQAFIMDITAEQLVVLDEFIFKQ